MQFTVRERDSKEPGAALFESLEPLLGGIGMALIEFSVFQGKRSAGVQARAVVMSSERSSVSSERSSAERSRSDETGVEDCARAHRLILPRLELAFPGKDIYLEVSSPGIDRLIKDGSEFSHYIGREVRCYRTDISDWTTGILRSADEEKIVLEAEGETILSYETIAKARLSDGAPKKRDPDTVHENKVHENTVREIKNKGG